MLLQWWTENVPKAAQGTVKSERAFVIIVVSTLS